MNRCLIKNKNPILLIAKLNKRYKFITVDIEYKKKSQNFSLNLYLLE